MGTWKSVTQVMIHANTLSTAPKKTKGEKMDLGTFLTDKSMLQNLYPMNGNIIVADDASSPGFMGR